MKKYMFRRIIAGAMALLTVAAYTPLTDFSVLQQSTAIVASARDAALTSQSLTTTAWELGDYFEANAEFNVPESSAGIDISFGEAATFGNVEVFEGELNDKGAIVKKSGASALTGERTFVGVTAVEYVAAEKKMLITYNSGSGEKYAVATIKDSTATKYFLAVTAATAGSNFMYTLGAKEIADSYTLNLAEVAAYVDTFTFTNTNGVEKTLNADTVAAGTYTAKAKTLVTLKTTARLNSNMDAYLDKDATDTANALYVYTFMLLENKADTVFAPATGDVSIANATGADAAAFDANSTYTIKAAGVSDQTETGASMTFSDFNAKAGQKVTMTSNVPFRIDTGAQKLVGTKYEAVYAYGVYADGKYTATFVNLVEETPRTGFTGGVKVEFINHSHTLSYTTSANRLYASCTSEMKDLVDAEVAAIYATIPATEDQLKADPKTTEYEVANNGKIQFTEENADKPTLTLTVDDTLLGVANNKETQHYVATINDGTYTYTYTYDTSDTTNVNAANKTITPVITKYVNGKSTTVATSEKNPDNFKATERKDKDGTTGLGLAKGITFAKDAFAKGGTYDVSLEVYDQNNNGKKVISYTYTVTPSEAINENVLEVSGAYYNKTNPMTYNLKATKNADGVYEIPVDEATVKSSGNVFVQFNFVKDKTKTDPAERYFSDEKFGFDGSDKGNVLDKVYTETITITDSSYTGGPFTVKWKLVKAKENDGLYYEFEEQGTANGTLINTKAGINGTAKEVQYDAIEEQLKGFLKSSDETLDVSKATFQYTATAPVDGNDIDLDGMKDGLPVLTAAQMASSEVNKVFYVYASVGSVSTVNPIKIELVEDATTSVHPVLNKLSYVYGERITLDDISFVTAAGTKVTFDKDDITNVVNGTKGDKKVDNSKITFTKLDSKGKPTGGAVTVVDSTPTPGTNEVNFLVPGKYQVEFGKNNVIAVTNGKTTKGYSVVANKVDNETVKYTIEVTKRTIEPSMFADYTADLSTTKQATITNTTYNSARISLPDVAMEDLTVTVSGGTSKATKAGTYQVELTPTGAAATYYEGTASVNWYAKTTATAVPALVWNQKGQNIYKGEDGSIQVHVEAFQAKDTPTHVTNGVYSGTDYAKDAAVTTASTVTTKFGFVYDKTQTFAKDADPDEVAKALKLDADGGFKGQKATNATKKGTNGIMTGLNFKVESADDYYWVRPYATVEGGAPTYGQPMLVDFQTVAQEVLQPTLESVQLVQKDVNGKSGLYYYVYATKYTRVDGEDRTIQPERWGIVLDRTGNYGATVANDDFDYEALTLDNCDAHSEALKNATKYTEDEVGTLISIKDSLSRVYVRNYIDFGNGLVVYNEKPSTFAENKHYTESASKTLATAMHLTTSGAPGVKMAASRKQTSTEIGATSDVVTIPARATLNTKANAKQVFEPIVIDNRDSDAAVAENKLTEFGLVVDRTGAAYNVYKEKYTTEAVPANFFTLSDSYKVYKAADVNKDYSTNATNKDDAVVYTLSATAPTSPTVFTYRAYAKYKGIDIYGNTQFVDNITASDASGWGKS